MSQVYYFLGELISIHWVAVGKKKEGRRERERDLKRERARRKSLVGEQDLPGVHWEWGHRLAVL